jgi:hypothetical protein
MISVSMQDIHLTANSKDYYSVQFTAVENEKICLVVANSCTNFATFLEVTSLESNKINF